MSSQLNEADRKLYQAIDEILHYVWDPIGVSAIPQARDEYHSYVPHVFGMLRDGKNEQAIADYLGQVITDRMGLNANAEHDLEVANILTDWKTEIRAKLT